MRKNKTTEKQMIITNYLIINIYFIANERKDYASMNKFGFFPTNYLIY